jgi:signal recognition particle subunit SRP54
MFKQLSERLQAITRKITGSVFTEDNMKESLREIRLALLEADVALPVVKSFIEDIQTKALGQTIESHLASSQALVKLVHDELVTLMGEANNALNLATQPPAVILMVGLQGSGKTTTAGKLAKKLIQEKKKVTLASLDIYRPAAIDQLRTLATQVDATWFPSTVNDNPVTIAKQAIDSALRAGHDVVILDTAGRLHIDDDLMKELKAVHAASNPIESLLVLDSMTGQDALQVAQAFNALIPLTGFILTKTDGDSRGGAALSLRKTTSLPIKFMGVGEKLDALEAFHPERVASRILGMGDMLSLIEELEQKTDKVKAEKAAKKFKKGQFDLEDFRDQLIEMKKMGGMASILSKLPGGMNLPTGALPFDEKVLHQFEAIINSMTIKERRYPDLLNASRKRRIAAGSGTDAQAINKLLKQFLTMQKMAKKFGKGGNMKKMMQAVQGMKGGFPGMGA